MELFLVGYILIPLGLLCFIYYPKKLYALTVFSIPFTGTAVFKIAYSGFVMEGIRPSMFLGFLCLLRHFITVADTGNLSIKKKAGIPLLFLSFLAFISISSLYMPYHINGRMNVLDTYSNTIMYAQPIPIVLKLQYVSQVAYFVFGCLLTYFFVLKNDTLDRLKSTIQIYLYATLFAAAWGLLEFSLFYLKIPYPSFLFNQNSMNFAGTIVLDGRPRIVSVALESSVLSQQLITALPLVFWPMWERADYLKKINLKILFIFIFLTLVLSTSATAIFGIIIFCLVTSIPFLVKRKMNPYILITIIFSLLFLLFSAPFFIQELISKLNTFSGEERLKALSSGWSYFIQYPILGIGWGVFTSWDLVICLLTGVGVIGLLVFLVIIISIFINFNNMKKIYGGIPVITKSISQALLMVILISQFSGFLFYTQYFWLILGLAIAASAFRFQSEEDYVMESLL